MRIWINKSPERPSGAGRFDILADGTDYALGTFHYGPPYDQTRKQAREMAEQYLMGVRAGTKLANSHITKLMPTMSLTMNTGVYEGIDLTEEDQNDR